MGLLLLVVILVLVFGGLPHWGYHSHGYGPSGVLGIVGVVLVVMLLTGRL